MEFVMRTSFFLISLAAVVAACADQQQPTSPVGAAARLESSTVGGEGGALPAQAPTTPQAKPTDQVGFTKVQMYAGAPAVLAAGDRWTVSATCPAGAVATAGGYDVIFPGGGTAPGISKSRPNGSPVADGWTIDVDNRQAGAADIKAWAWVSCAS
jgi:hypothetical protein